jgi:hypothetical protein
VDGLREVRRLGRRDFLTYAAKFSVLGFSLPTLLQACAREPTPARFPGGYKEKTKAIQDQATALNGDVLDFQLASDDWEGPFGFVKIRLHKGLFEGRDVYFVRTDASEQSFAASEKLVFVPKLAPLEAPGLSGSAFLISGGTSDQGTVFSSEPGRDDYSPAWRVHQVRWEAAPRKLVSVSDIQAAESKKELGVEQTNIVLNAPIVKWSSGALAVDRELKDYLGQGQLVEAPDTVGLTATFKLHECFPNTRYMVTDHSIAMAAEMTKTALAPGLHGGPSTAGATGRTNVFMNGLKGPGPMGFQPSAFDLPVGDALWSPYWDHFTYAWKEGRAPRLLSSESEIHRARDAGELEEFPGTPDTQGEKFTVNCPAPISAPNVFAG